MKQIATLVLLLWFAGCQSNSPPLPAPTQPMPTPVSSRRAWGIDVSHYQHSIDWMKVKAAGKSFAMAKATEGTGYVDEYFKANVAGARAAGVVLGAYHFARYDRSSAIAEANFFWSIVRPYIKTDGYTLQPMLDVEHAPAKGQTPAVLTKWVNDWCTQVQRLAAADGLSVTPMIYCNLSFAKGRLDHSIQPQWPLVYAYWVKGAFDPQTFNPPPPGVFKSWVIWQYGGSTVPGVRGNCDSDVLNGDERMLGNYVVRPLR